ncbi:hypothetical protein P7K49_024719, partial [Saguinus oedipus]
KRRAWAGPPRGQGGGCSTMLPMAPCDAEVLVTSAAGWSGEFVPGGWEPHAL